MSSILLYHRVCEASPDNQYLSVSPAHFEEHLAILSAERKVLPLHRLLAGAAEGVLDAKAVAITFDDGYADNAHNALPLLAKYKCHATIFVTAGLVGYPHGFWYDVLEHLLLVRHDVPASLRVHTLKASFSLATPQERLLAHEALFAALRSATPRLQKILLHEVMLGLGVDPLTYVTPHPLLDEAQLRELARSPWIEIGCHTLTHPVLSGLSASGQRGELVESRSRLEKATGKPVRLLAYPYGSPESFNDTTRALVAELGFDAGIANIQGELTLPIDLAGVPRRLVRDWSGPVFGAWLRAADKAPYEARVMEERMPRVQRYMERTHGSCGGQCAASPTSLLRITHMNTVIGRGGAAAVAAMLMKEQRQHGHRSVAVAGESFVADNDVYVFDAAPQRGLDSLARKEGLQDYALQGSHRLLRSALVAEADVLHLHNLHGGYCNPFSLYGLARTRPVVWTLHDMHALTGHCAHSLSCDRWVHGCGLCPDLGVYPAVQADSTHRVWRDRRDLYASVPLHVVVPSQWLADIVGKSILAGHPVELIPNGIDTRLFCPADKAAARRRLGLPEDVLIVGGAAVGGPVENPWKGGGYVTQAAHALRERFPEALYVGRGGGTADCDAVRLLPHTDDPQEMATFYQALDVLLYPTLADTCPLVVIEAQACGVPVVGFAVGGVPDLVAHGETGVLVPGGDGRAFVEAALVLGQDVALRTVMGLAARRKAVAQFDVGLMASRYEKVYERARAAWPSRVHATPAMVVGGLHELVQTPDMIDMVNRVAAVTQQPDTTPVLPLEEPVSRLFGFDRGTPVDRVYVERFLAANKHHITGRVLEIGDATYTLQYGTGVVRSDVLNATPVAGATIVGDFATGRNIPQSAFDCVILTQTLHCIYDFKSALRHIYASLAAGGVLLLTAPGITQVSRYDMDRWGDYWRFTDRALRSVMAEAMPDADIDVTAYGNCTAAKAFLDGRAAHELAPEVFEHDDNDYQLLLTAVVRKAESGRKGLRGCSNSGAAQKAGEEREGVSHLANVTGGDAGNAEGDRMHAVDDVLRRHREAAAFYPTQLAIEPARVCNARCTMCPSQVARRPKGFLPTKHHTLMLDKVRQWGAPIRDISHAGLGEPLLDKELEAKILRDKQFFPAATVSVYSNGGVLTEARSRSLLDTGVDVLSFSVNAFEPATYKGITGLDRERTYANIMRLLDLREQTRAATRVQVSCIPVPSLGTEELERFCNFWQARVDSVVVPPVINWGGCFDIETRPLEQRLPCHFIFSVLMVDWDGTVKRCCEDYDSKFPMGNLLHQDPHDIFNSIMMQEHRRDQLDGSFDFPVICRRCVETARVNVGSFWESGGGVPCS